MRIAALCLAIVAIAAASPAGAKKKTEPAAPAAAPPLWRVADEDSAVYLFASTGLAPAGAPWRSRALSRAIDASETVYFEAPVSDPAEQAAANKIFEDEAMAPKGAALSKKLDEETREALAAVTEKAGLPAEALEPLKPWAAFVVLSTTVQPKTEEQGVEAQITDEAKARGRSIRYLGSVAESLSVLTKMPAADQKALFIHLIGDFDRQRDHAREGFEAWRTGDLAASDAYYNASLRDGAPAVFEELVTARAGVFAERIGEILKSPEPAFIALNAGYLVGEGALPERLEAMGYTVTRIEE